MPFYPQIASSSAEIFPHLSPEDAAWAAGLLEGDGSFPALGHGRPRVALQIQDKDLCLRIQSLFGGSLIETPQREAHHKKIFMWYTPSARLAVEVMVTVYPLMLSRRRAQIERAVKTYAAHVNQREQASPYRDEVFDRVTELTRAGMTSADIADEVGLSPHMVRQVRRRETRKRTPQRVHPPTSLPLPRKLEACETLPWAAGLLDAEGSFRVDRLEKPRIACVSSDLDVLERLESILGGTSTKASVPRPTHWKQTYRWYLTGSASDRARILSELRPLMSGRRQGQIDGCLSAATATVTRIEERQLEIRSRDLRIREMMAQGFSERAISRQLGIARETVAKQRG